jgi:3D (Asp-Asp-Asp) domain-containing protein
MKRSYVFVAALLGAALISIASRTEEVPTIPRKEVVKSTIKTVQIPHAIAVSATCYWPSAAQCDKSFNATATGAEINVAHPDEHRWIAISRDILKQGFKMGDTVEVRGTWLYDGPWVIQDKMNKRWKNKIDFLIHPKQRGGNWKNVTLSKYSRK